LFQPLASVWVVDGDTRRVSWFSSTGKFGHNVQTVSVPTEASISPRARVFSMPQQLFADGSIFALGGYLARDVATGRVTSQAMLRLSPDAQTADTIGKLSLENEALVLRGARVTQYRVQPYQDGPMALASRVESRVLTVDRSAHPARVGVIRVSLLGAHGDTLWKQSLTYTPARLPEREVDSVQRDIERKAGRELGPLVRRAMYRPSFRTPVTAVVSTGDGGWWLKRADQGPARSGAYLELDRRGRPTRCIDVGASSFVLWVDKDDVWGVELDADDVPRITRFAIREVR
jgi:hypothetical protein